MKFLARLVNTLGRFVRQGHGQDLIEYALLTSLISLAAVAALSTMSEGLADIYKDTGVRMGARSVSEQ